LLDTYSKKFVLLRVAINISSQKIMLAFSNGSKLMDVPISNFEMTKLETLSPYNMYVST
jgi:hypothetical protein